MINMLSSTPKKHSEYVVWKVLVVLNNIVFKDGDETHFLVERELVARVLPLCESTVKRVRLQALWILGNMSAQKEAVIQTHIYTPKVVDAIVKVGLNSMFDISPSACYICFSQSAGVRHHRQDDQPWWPC